MCPEGWLTNAEGVSYPPAPWRLQGSLYLSLWLAPRAPLEGLLPAGAVPVAWGSRIITATAWVIYEPPGMLAYRELLCSVLVRLRGKWAVTIPRIWVDRPASLAGGRALWSIPKELAEFRMERDDGLRASAWADGREIASCQFRSSWSLPGRPRGTGTVVQTGRGDLVTTTMQAQARCRLGRGEWAFAPDGPLGFLAGAKPLFSAELTEMVLNFGV